MFIKIIKFLILTLILDMSLLIILIKWGNRQSQSNFIFFRFDILYAIIVKLPSVNFSIMTCVNFSEKHLEVLLDQFLIEERMSIEIAFNPSIEFFSLKNIISVFIVFKEDVLDELPTKIIHNYYDKRYIFLRFLWSIL